MIGIKEADRKYIRSAGPGRMPQAKTPGEISWQHWDVALQLGIQLDSAVVGSVVAVVAVVVVVLVVGVGHPTGNKTKRPTKQFSQPKSEEAAVLF